MKENLKFLVSEYKLELFALGFGLLALPGIIVVAGNHLAGDLSKIGSTIMVFAIGVGLLCICFLPYIVAKMRKHRNSLAILVLNLLAFPTFGLCWIIALVWACLNQETR